MLEVTAPVMGDEVLPLEITKAIDKAIKKDERAIKSAGYGASDLCLEITKGTLGTLSDHLQEKLTEKLSAQDPLRALLPLVSKLGADRIALATLSACLHSIAINSTSHQLCLHIGSTIANEVFAASLVREYPRLAANIEKQARQKHSTVENRQKAARKVLKAARKKEPSKYGKRLSKLTNAQSYTVGHWLVEQTLLALPNVFERVFDTDNTWRVFVTEGAEEAARIALGEVIDRNPVWMPRTEKPRPWTEYSVPHPDHRLSRRVKFLRTHFNETHAAAKAAVKDGSMKPALDAVTTLQSVPWRINKRIYGVLCGVRERGIEVEGLPRREPVEVPEWPEGDIEDLEKTRIGIERTEAKKRNRALSTEQLMFEEDMQTAEHLLDAPQFYTMMNCDWRGRVNALPHFCFQREDRVRALFEFAHGEPIGTDGLRWLQIHVANNWSGPEKLDKAPMEDRVAWVIKNTARIQEMVEVPLKDLWWIEADQPFLFLAACMELASAVAAGPTFVTHLPVSFDGSCSGLQHLSAMTRDEDTAQLVNLTDNERPSDVYGVVGDLVKRKVEDDLLDGSEKSVLARRFLDLGIDRGLVKRNVMTYSYSSKKFGMAGQQQTDTLDKLFKEVLEHKRGDHPFGQNRMVGSEKPTKAAHYIASHVFDAIEQRIHKPALAMRFFQDLAKALAHEGKPLRWKTPAGIPWINRYHEPVLHRLTLWMWDRGVKRQFRPLVADGDHLEINKKEAANGVAPNFVHACDAAHLLLTVNAAAARGITDIATVHDSFGCLASRAGEFNKIIREEFVRMYTENDVLSEVLESAKTDLTEANWHRLSDVPESGNLNLEQVKDAKYAFA